MQSIYTYLTIDDKSFVRVDKTSYEFIVCATTDSATDRHSEWWCESRWREKVKRKLASEINENVPLRRKKSPEIHICGSGLGVVKGEALCQVKYVRAHVYYV